MLVILGELCWLEFFKTIYLETSNVRFGSFFQNPVTFDAVTLILLCSYQIAFELLLPPCSLVLRVISVAAASVTLIHLIEQHEIMKVTRRYIW